MSAVTARDIMTPDPVTIGRDVPVVDAARIMVERNIGSLPVVEDGRLVGLVSEGDLIMQDVKIEFPTYIHLLDGFIMYPPAHARFEGELKKAVAATVGDVMTSDPVTVQVTTSYRRRRYGPFRAGRFSAARSRRRRARGHREQARHRKGDRRRADVDDRSTLGVGRDRPGRDRAQRRDAEGPHQAGHAVHGRRQGGRLRARSAARRPGRAGGWRRPPRRSDRGRGHRASKRRDLGSHPVAVGAARIDGGRHRRARSHPHGDHPDVRGGAGALRFGARYRGSLPPQGRHRDEPHRREGRGCPSVRRDARRVPGARARGHLHPLRHGRCSR